MFLWPAAVLTLHVWCRSATDHCGRKQQCHCAQIQRHTLQQNNKLQDMHPRTHSIMHSMLYV